ncbi:uncharacterized protein LOC142776506 isoform X1 [Rhipicephalus microplus]|uniref:uncharacterized protein LOC142776506 isoform X1 n=1 Tax=Rhipicephalus microplus TaxID=6941 RepID=UPI003F6B43C1
MWVASNPFLYFVQIFGLVHIISETCAGATKVAPSHGWNASDCHKPTDNLPALSWTSPSVFQSKIPPHHHVTSSWGTSSAGSAIKGTPEDWAGTGHGGITTMWVASNPFLYFVQVSKRYGKCFRSSDPFLVMLPRPRLFGCGICCILFDVASSVRRILLLSGDIETNPGPTLEQIAKQLSEIATDIKEIKEKRLTDIDKKLDSLANLEIKVTSCQQQIANLEARIYDLENQSRRSNIIVYGLPESKEETNESLESTVNNDIIKGILELDPVTIERIHRLGRPSPGKVRPVILKLLDSRDKTKILKQCFKLKNADFSIGEDFSVRVREIRRKLWRSCKTNRDNGDKASLVYNKLYINKKEYVWDEDKNDIVPVQKNDARSTVETEIRRPNTRSHKPRQS